jgi:hypothetical protein
VAFFELLGWTQNLNHQRYRLAANPGGRNPNSVDRVGTVNLRSLDVLDRLNGPFDLVSHTVDVRPISRLQGWYNIRKVGFFLWRLRQFPLQEVTARRSLVAQDCGYHFSPLGNPAPLFHQPQVEGDEAGLAGEIHVPGPIRPLALHRELEDCRQLSEIKGIYYGDGLSFSIKRNGHCIPPENIVCQDLTDWTLPPSTLTYKKADGTVLDLPIEAAVDPHLGRITFPFGSLTDESHITVNYSYGFSADMGGGPYDRRQTLADPDLARWNYFVSQKEKSNPPSHTYRSLNEALTAWAAPTQGNRDTTIIPL